MYFQSTGRNQRPRGFHVKQGFKFAFILAVCIWLLYQIKHSNNSKGGRTVEAKFSKERGVPILGRKGDLELSAKGGGDAVLEAGGNEKDRGGGDDMLDANADEEEIIKLHKQKEYKHGHVETDAEGKKLDLDRPYNLSRNSENIEIEMSDKDNEVFSEDNSGLENSKSIISDLGVVEDEKDQKGQISYDERGHNIETTNLVEQGDEKELERPSKELQSDENIRIHALKQGKDEETGSSKENDEDTDKTIKQVSDTASAIIIDQNEVANGLHGFHDENGVPQGGNDVVEFTLAKSRDGQANYILQQENLTSSNHPQQENFTSSETNSTDAVLDAGINSVYNFQIRNWTS